MKAIQHSKLENDQHNLLSTLQEQIVIKQEVLENDSNDGFMYQWPNGSPDYETSHHETEEWTAASFVQVKTEPPDESPAANVLKIKVEDEIHIKLEEEDPLDDNSDENAVIDQPDVTKNALPSTNVTFTYISSDFMGKSYKCYKCGYSSADVTVLAFHIKSCKKDYHPISIPLPPPRCTGCRHKPPCNDKFECAAKKVHRCTKCDFLTGNKKVLQKHIRKHKQDELKSEISNFHSLCREDLNKHKHTRKKLLECSHCDFITENEFTYQRHLLQHTSKPNMFKCDKCDYTTTLLRYLAVHQRRHVDGRPYKCKSCKYSTITKALLQKHILIHTRSGIYSCKNCKYSTASKSNLFKHVWEHRANRTFRCNNCDFSTCFKGNIIKHVKTHMIGYVVQKQEHETKSFSCANCQYSTQYKRKLIAHVKIHKNSVFKCTVRGSHTENENLHCKPTASTKTHLAVQTSNPSPTNVT